MSTSNASEFSVQRWQAERGHVDERTSPRAAMLEALEREHLRRGMPREEVRQLLGEPDSATAAADEYDLGGSPVGVTLESYVIAYDAQGRVTTFGLRRR
jgi:hypothetical protein